MRNPSHDERISSFLDDALPEAERFAFEAELRTNSELEQQVAELRQLRSDVALLPRYSVTEGFAQRVVTAAVAAKADENASISPAAKSKSQPVRFSKVARGVVIGMAIAASAAILMISLPWLNLGGNGPTPVVATKHNTSPVQTGNDNVIAAEPNPLKVVWSSLPGDGEALVLTLRSAQGAAAGKALQDALVEQGIVRLRPADKVAAGVVGRAYRDRVKELTGDDRSKSAPAAAALYLEISREDLELALTQMATKENKVEFVPSELLAFANSTSSQGPKAIGELPEVDASGNGQFVELNPGMYRLAKTTTPHGAGTSVEKPSSTGKVRVLILVEEVQ